MELHGVDLIAIERKRQVAEEGWSVKHDSELRDGALEKAAVCYALVDIDMAGGLLYDRLNVPKLWPWDSAWWKPKNRLRNLVRAGALIAAAIDRLLAEG